MRETRPRVLFLSRNYPTPAQPTRGLWAQRMAHAAARVADVSVLSPVPWVPPVGPVGRFAQWRRVPRQSQEANGVDVRYPRVPAGHSYYTHDYDARLTWPGVRRAAARMHAERPFDLVHAQFVYPDGVIAARLGRELGVPVVTTEQAFWRPWLEHQRREWRQVSDALPGIHTVTGVSEAVRREVEQMVAGRTRTAVIPNVVDDASFPLRADAEPRDPNRILFVGLVRPVKGLDVLVSALSHLVKTHPKATLRVVSGDALFRAYSQAEAEVRRQVAALGLEARVEWVGPRSPEQVGGEIREAAVVAVPSRRETFCSVVVEAFASGTPVVSTKCGGPDDLVTPETGLLVPVENPEALAQALATVLDTQDRYDARHLHEYAVSGWGYAASARRLGDFYASVLSS